MQKQSKSEAGFSLVELMISIGIFSILILTLAGLFTMTLYGSSKSKTRIEAQEQNRLALEHMTYEIRRANGIFAGASFGVNLAANANASVGFTMSDSTHNPTTFSVASGILYIKQGANPAVALTSTDAAVSSLIFTNLSTANGRSKDILVSMIVTKPDPTGIAALNVTYPMEMAVEITGK